MERKFSQRSKDNLVGVHPDLIKVLTLALEKSKSDFTVTEGLRSHETQRKYYDQGHSKTLTGSRHLKGSDGYGHAVDVIFASKTDPYNWDRIFEIADGIRLAAIELNIPIRWGGAWHYRLNEESGRTARELNANYLRTQRETGKKPFVDGVHFELPNSPEFPQ